MSVRKLWVPDNSGVGVELTAESGSDALKPEGAIRRSDGGPEVDSSKARWYSGWKLCSRGSFIPRRRDARGRGLASLPVCGVTFLPSLRICLTHPLNTRGPLTHLKNSIVGM